MIAERYKFKMRKQLSNESISTFLATLKQLSLYCEFGDTLDNNLRDQLVWGLRNEKIQRKLLTEACLTLEKAVELSLAWEAAEKDAEKLSRPGGGTDQTEINFMKGRRQQSGIRGQQYGTRGKFYGQQQGTRETVCCYCCGKANHLANECKAKNLSCNICGKKRALGSRM